MALCRLSTTRFSYGFMALLTATKMNIFTLPLSIAFPTPTHDGSTVLVEDQFTQQLGEHVCWLIVGVDGMQHDFALLNIVPEMVELDIDVLGTWSHLWDLGDFEGTVVVLKDLAVDHQLGGDHAKTLSLELFN